MWAEALFRAMGTHPASACRAEVSPAQIHNRSCLPPVPVFCPGATRIRSAHLCSALPVLTIPSAHEGTSLSCPCTGNHGTRNRQAKVRERPARNTLTWLKKRYGYTNKCTKRTPGEHSYTALSSSSLTRSHRQARGMKSLLSCFLLGGSTKKTPDGFVGDAVISGNLSKGFVVLTDTALHVRPFFQWDAVLRLTRTWMLLCGSERRDTAKYLLEREESLRELAVRGEKVNQHW